MTKTSDTSRDTGRDPDREAAPLAGTGTQGGFAEAVPPAAPRSLGIDKAGMVADALRRRAGKGIVMPGLGAINPARPLGAPQAPLGTPPRQSNAPRVLAATDLVVSPPRPVLMPGPLRPPMKAAQLAVQAGGKTPAAGIRPVAAPAQMRGHHRGILGSFFALVALPSLLTGGYLWLVAEDQYASTLGFSVRTEDVSSSLGLLGGLTRLSGGGSSDADILYDYIHSQELVSDLDRRLDLRAIYAQGWPQDPFFAFNPKGTIEDLLEHWESKVKITYDTSTGLMTLRVLAFTRDQAQMVARQILERSTEKVNELSQEAREDATRYTREEMERALERLKAAREALTRFRMTTRVVDPVADLQGQMGVLNGLQAQLADSYVQLDLLRTTATPNDPRITQLEQRIAVIDRRMAEERRKFGEDGQGPGGEDYATMVAEFERLNVDREFAEQTYHAALAAHDAALAEAQRKSRYLAAHILPTLAEKAEYPARWTLFGLTSFFLLMAWSIAVLVFYSLRDRR